MRDLVPFAHRLAEAFGDSAAACSVAADIATRGLAAFGPAHDDTTRLLREQAISLGLCGGDGTARRARCAELILVAEIIAALPDAPRPAPTSPPLVFTAPLPSGSTSGRQRLDVLVADIIRMATEEVRIGGPFWNDEGLEALLDVLGPAVEGRGVRCTFYVHTPSEPKYLDRVRTWMQNVSTEGVDVRWYRGPDRSLMHAKFVTADSRRGYLGSANFTSFGFAQHVEMGVELTAQQTDQLLRFLDKLELEGLFAAEPAPRS